MATVPTPAPDDGGDDRQHRDEPRTGFFTVYKPTQGRTTRIATGIAVALLIGLTVHFFLTQVPAWFFPNPENPTRTRRIWIGIIAGVALLVSAFAWRLINRPSNAEFLIATDSEMKKVNWTSRKALIGSTKVVITFMLLIAGILFIVDLLFSYVFYLGKVLKFPPLGV